VIKVIRQLSVISALQVLAGAFTGVLLARSLGVAGRGDLAAITAPLSVAPYALGLGMTTYATRATARGVDPRKLLGTLGGASLVLGLAAIPLGLWLASILAAGRREVGIMIAIGFVLLPMNLVAGILTSVAMGLEEWKHVTRQRLIVVALPLPAYALLAIFGTLTVTSAAVTLLATGLLGAVPMWTIVRRSWPPATDRRLAGEALRYGAKVTPITLSQLLNLTLDQVIMAPLVSSRQLGLYTVAVTVAGLSTTLASSMGIAAFPRLAQEGAESDPARLIRVGMLAVLLAGIALACVSPVALPLLFGPQFSGAYPLALVLLAACVPLSGANLFAVVYVARDKVGTAGLSEVVALAMTVAGLLIFLRPFGAMGAAVVSLVAYTTNFLWLLAVAPRKFGGRRRDYVLPRVADLRYVLGQAIGAARSLGRPKLP
jgi:O-antigen/teichoic acid export membrane protein